MDPAKKYHEFVGKFGRVRRACISSEESSDGGGRIELTQVMNKLGTAGPAMQVCYLLVET